MEWIRSLPEHFRRVVGSTQDENLHDLRHQSYETVHAGSNQVASPKRVTPFVQGQEPGNVFSIATSPIRIFGRSADGKLPGAEWTVRFERIVVDRGTSVTRV